MTDASQTDRYIGRFAPSPSGPLHFGSLLAATASYLDARSNQGKWLLRIEDLDHYRTDPIYNQMILDTLEAYGFEWDSHVLYQTQRLDAYENALQQLQSQAQAYPCYCTRKQLRATAPHGQYGLIYPGNCRPSLTLTSTAHLNLQRQAALRVRTQEHRYCFKDRVRGFFCQQLAQDVGDFIIKRSDGVIAYQLAVVVDDAYQGITHVVRGADLLDNTPRQLYLQHLLGVNQPEYLHIPVVIDQTGRKLSKQTAAPALEATQVKQALQHLYAVSQFLGQKPPALSHFSGLADYWQWAIANWHVSAIPAVQSQQLDYST